MGLKASFEVPHAVLFDLDGTLLDSLPGIRHSAVEAFNMCGLARCDVDLRSLIGPPIRTILAGMGADLKESDLDALERAFRTSYDSDGWRMTYHYAGAAEMLQTMHAEGRRLFVVSNKPRHISVKILEAEGTLGLFEEVVTRDSRMPAYAGKSEMMTFLLQKWEMNPADCLMVGDTMEDAESALRAGMRFCLMTHGYGDVPVGSGVPVALRLDGFAELIENPLQGPRGNRH